MKIYFIQDNSFLRTAQKTNPFFDPIIKVCDEHGVEWKVLVPEIPQECGYDKERIVSFQWLSIAETWFLRFVRLWYRKSLWKMEVLFAKIFGRFWARSFRADLYITIAGNMSYEFATIYPHARVVDLQHGVIYSRHSGYFDNGARLKESRRVLGNIEYWLYGQGYADCFFKHPENKKNLEGRVKVIGDVFGHAEATKCNRDLVVVSAQFKPECSQECIDKQVALLRNFLEEFYRLAGDKYKVLIKHHPRCAGVEALSALYRDFPKFKETKADWPDLYGRMMLHVTISSTVVFDAASNGIPTYLIEPPVGETFLENWFWRDDYGYPYFGKPLADLLSMAGKVDVHKEVRMWYNHFYAPFTVDQCEKLLGVHMS